jgi:hypothetical protein
MEELPAALFSWLGSVRLVDAWGTPMTTLQAVFLGIMLALTPSVAVLAFLLWRDGVDLWPDGGFPVLESNDQPSYGDAQ